MYRASLKGERVQGGKPNPNIEEVALFFSGPQPHILGYLQSYIISLCLLPGSFYHSIYKSFHLSFYRSVPPSRIQIPIVNWQIFIPLHVFH